MSVRNITEEVCSAQQGIASIEALDNLDDADAVERVSASPVQDEEHQNWPAASQEDQQSEARDLRLMQPVSGPCSLRYQSRNASLSCKVQQLRHERSTTMYAGLSLLGVEHS